jgi:hypothetical protein
LLVLLRFMPLLPGLILYKTASVSDRVECRNFYSIERQWAEHRFDVKQETRLTWRFFLASRSAALSCVNIGIPLFKGLDDRGLGASTVNGVFINCEYICVFKICFKTRLSGSWKFNNNENINFFELRLNSCEYILSDFLFPFLFFLSTLNKKTNKRSKTT